MKSSRFTYARWIRVGRGSLAYYCFQSIAVQCLKWQLVYALVPYWLGCQALKDCLGCHAVETNPCHAIRHVCRPSLGCLLEKAQTRLIRSEQLDQRPFSIELASVFPS